MATNAKQQLRELLDRMPDDCSIEDIQYQLYVMETIQRRIDLAEKSEVVSHAEAETRLNKRLRASFSTGFDSPHSSKPNGIR